MLDAAQNVIKYRPYTQRTYHHHDSFTIGPRAAALAAKWSTLSECQRLRIIISKGQRGRHAPEVGEK